MVKGIKEKITINGVCIHYQVKPYAGEHTATQIQYLNANSMQSKQAHFKCQQLRLWREANFGSALNATVHVLWSLMLEE